MPQQLLPLLGKEWAQRCVSGYFGQVQEGGCRHWDCSTLFPSLANQRKPSGTPLPPSSSGDGHIQLLQHQSRLC